MNGSNNLDLFGGKRREDFHVYCTLCHRNVEMLLKEEMQMNDKLPLSDNKYDMNELYEVYKIVAAIFNTTRMTDSHFEGRNVISLCLVNLQSL